MKPRMTAEYSAKDVAKWFIVRNEMAMAEEDAEPISNMKLQKLLYYAQGVYLAIYDKRLFHDALVAWKHGPVVIDVYFDYNDFGANGIKLSEPFDVDKIDNETRDVLEDVYKEFGQYSAWKLREMTHGEDPWKCTAQSKVIDTGLIQSYFKENYIA